MNETQIAPMTSRQRVLAALAGEPVDQITEIFCTHGKIRMSRSITHNFTGCV